MPQKFDTKTNSACLHKEHAPKKNSACLHTEYATKQQRLPSHKITALDFTQNMPQITALALTQNNST
jgi:hypothetical protein